LLDAGEPQSPIARLLNCDQSTISRLAARKYRNGEVSYLELARSASDPDARDRFIGIAQHYRSLAKIEQSIADQRPTNMAATEPFGLRVKACSH